MFDVSFDESLGVRKIGKNYIIGSPQDKSCYEIMKKLWKKNLEGGASARLGVDRNCSVALLYDPVHHRQAQAGSLSGTFGCEKGLEDASLGFRIHPASRIADRKHHIGARLQ